MTTYRTPGVYVEEIPVFPPSVAPVATAIPAFIGCTEKATGRRGENLLNTPTRITSLLEYEALFGGSPAETMEVAVTKRVDDADRLLGVDVKWKDDKAPTTPAGYMHYAMQLYFANGGGPCYVHSIGLLRAEPPPADPAEPTLEGFVEAITALEAEDEPTLLLFPDAVRLADGGAGVVNAALQSCQKMQDRFVIADVPNAEPGGTSNNSEVSTAFRDRISHNSVEFLKYGAAYFPYLDTNLPFASNDESITLSSFATVKNGGAPQNDPALEDKSLGETGLKQNQTAVYAAVRAFIDQAFVRMPPSAAVAGVYAQVDRTRGVWKAPANVGLSRVIGPAVNITNDMQDGLNIDPNSGKSVNAIRAFFGKGTLVWGARTLAGNDNEWRYINVRRFANFVEESIRKAIGVFVFEPNDANTWVKVRSMIENFLINQWRAGALMGAKPEQAFRVAVGLGQTMSADDVLNGYLIVEVYLAIVRPAEFIVLRFMQKMPEA